MTDTECTLSSTCQVKIVEHDEGFYIITAVGRTGETWVAIGRTLSIAGHVVEATTIGESTLREWHPESGDAPILIEAVYGYRTAAYHVGEFKKMEREWTRYLRGELYNEDGEYIPDTRPEA